MIISVVTGLEVKHPRIKAAEQTILTLIGCKVMHPEKAAILDLQIRRLKAAIKGFEEGKDNQELLAVLIRQSRKMIDQVLDEVEK